MNELHRSRAPCKQRDLKREDKQAEEGAQSEQQQRDQSGERAVISGSLVNRCFSMMMMMMRESTKLRFNFSEFRKISLCKFVCLRRKSIGFEHPRGKVLFRSITSRSVRDRQKFSRKLLINRRQIVYLVVTLRVDFELDRTILSATTEFHRFFLPLPSNSFFKKFLSRHFSSTRNFLQYKFMH